MDQAVVERFWNFVKVSGECWEWFGTKDSAGYGKLRIDRKNVSAHRISFEIENGPIAPGVLIDHRCHNPACVRPAHLREANHKTNAEHRKGANINSQTGVRGVWFNKGKYKTRVMHNGQRYYLGHYDTLAEAEAAVVAKRLELFTYNDMDRQEAA